MISRSKPILAAFIGCVLGSALTTTWATDVSGLSENEKQESFQQRYAQAKQDFLKVDSSIALFKRMAAASFDKAVKSLEKAGAKLDENELRLFLINNCGTAALECLEILTSRMIQQGALDNAIGILESLRGAERQLIKAYKVKLDFEKVRLVHESIIANFKPMQVCGGYEEMHPRAEYAKFLLEIGDSKAAKAQYEAMSLDANPSEARYARFALEQMNAAN